MTQRGAIVEFDPVKLEAGSFKGLVNSVFLSSVLPLPCLSCQATWRLEAADVADTKKGERIASPQLQLWRHSFRIEIYPRGDGRDAESDGYLGVFMYVPVTALIDIDLGGVTRRLNITEEMLKETNNGALSRGWHKMWKVPDLTNPIEVHVRFVHIEGKDAKEAATRVQALWRGVETRRWEELRRAEERRCRRQCRELTAALCLQLAWRLYQRRLQRRWHSKMVQAQSTPYDAILAFESLSQFLSTGDIRFLQHAESKLQVASAARFRIVAVVGLFDKGKTFLINKLFGVNLPSGKLHTTKGLSFLWIEERRMLVLDSAGVQSTVSYRAQAVQDAILDAQTTESLMFEMISRIAHHMIFVVNDLTWFEQKYVAMLHQKYVQGGQQKELVVVHNLRNTTEIQEACKLFSRQVTRCYDGEQSHLGELIFTQDAGPGAPPLHHIGLCYEFSKAGDAFNEKNRQHLLQSLEHRNSLGSELVLADILTAELARLLPRFVNIEARCPESSVCSSDQAIGVEFCDAQQPTSGDHAGYNCVGALRMNLAQEGARVAMKTRGVISPLGEIIAHDVSFDPIVNVYDRTTTHGTSRIIRIECPGVTEEDVEWEELPNGVKISVDKKRPIDEHAVQPVQPIRQHHGVWEQEFSFDYSEGRFELSPEEATFENGVLTVVLKKAAQPRRGKFGQIGDKGRSHLVAHIAHDPDAQTPSPVPSSSSFSVVTAGGA